MYCVGCLFLSLANDPTTCSLAAVGSPNSLPSPATLQSQLTASEGRSEFSAEALRTYFIATLPFLGSSDGAMIAIQTSTRDPLLTTAQLTPCKYYNV